ncbi:hypothetical protein E2C01_095431 [Portunus trituberculatus]|uniref:Uncharacterized protein n=1 Tax=Portunus trituberculatus TaxID=210409 RepID=A0A5B7K5R2_PORTR|nr:hypothetical protein [Portunus trituberculatus]
MAISQSREPGITEHRSVVRGRRVTVSTLSYRDETQCNRLLSALLSASPRFVLAKSATWLLECTGDRVEWRRVYSEVDVCDGLHFVRQARNWVR